MFSPYDSNDDISALIDYAYSGNIFPDIGFSGPGIREVTYDSDPIQTYKYNSRNFRSDELSKNTEIVFSGCSFTEGMGVPEDYIWGSLLASKLDMTYSNLGQSGTSIYYIVKNLFGYFKEYGHPKYLFCLFPDYIRYVAATSPNLFINFPTMMGESAYGVYNGVSNFKGGSHIVAPKYLKRPYDLDDVISNETAFMLNGVALSSLIQYCKAAGITFVWSTWNRVFSKFIELNVDKYDFSGYINIKNNEWHVDSTDSISSYFHENFDVKTSNSIDYCNDLSCKLTTTDCHSELYQLFPNNFHHGTDIYARNQGTHWGVHRHAHVAEIFLKALID